MLNENNSYSKPFLNSIIKQFQYYKMLGDKTFDQVEEEYLFWTPNENCNSISIIVNHLNGNMLSRWTDIFNSDGEKESRKRDQEFEAIINSKSMMLEKWEQGWDCLYSALQDINEHNFNQLIYIRNIGHSVPEAINRQLAHYSYHIGQIVYIGKIVSKNWASLSIAKGDSKIYNAEKFSKDKSRGHFTDEFLK